MPRKSVTLAGMPIEPTPRPTIRSQADLARMWATLMGAGGFGRHSVWMLWVLDEEPLPQITEFEESVEPLSGRLLENFVEVLEMLAAGLDGRASVAFLLSRPGSSIVTAPDRAWAATLYDAARSAGIACETVHLATQDDVRPLPMDELGALPA